ncbi:MAG: phosphoglycolate phosphatase [Eubacteriaceae bacterium]|jgi:phosphoglycolate phosphatase|nr:phosphoglycolate phosphatase [Eubacteriaceae bacterium]MDK2904599.1 phosphoglycolate phosphatase [Eubacteriaceae bacterium]MDK2935431.1 phosphoglycolate phosphatase [Eubacteriaceae bacterium]MDK2960988.1 phosphoglycolate phosphatase [Eubacteriaceae bacterium]MDN5306883.1 phosphoglycolate phosphatase [Eubacteriaceae bacterium]
MHRYKGVVFDLDGTLVDSLHDLIDSCNEIMKYHNFPQHSYEEGKALIGRGLKNLMRMAVPEEYQDDEYFLNELTDMLRAEYGDNYTKKTKAYPGIEKLLDYLTFHKIPFGVCTNKPDPMAKSLVKTVFKKYHFVDVIGETDQEPRKPDPAIVNKLCGEMGLKASECLYVGDSIVDYETAKNAGMLCVLCTWGFEKIDTITALDDALWVHNPMRIVDALRYGREMYEVFNEKPEKHPHDEKKSYWESHKL